MLRKIPVITFVMLALSCSSGDAIPKDIMDINQMKPIVWDLMRSGELVNLQYRADSALALQRNTALYSQVFSIYGVTKDQFYKSYTYYQEHPDKNKILIDSILQYASRERGKLYQKLK